MVGSIQPRPSQVITRGAALTPLSLPTFFESAVMSQVDYNPDTDDPVETFSAAVTERIKAQVLRHEQPDRMKAVATVAGLNPRLHIDYLKAVNSRKGQRQLDEKAEQFGIR